jgi:membrane protease YdiL (CAAX protease family)
MMFARSAGPGFWTTLGLLLVAAFRRSRGRARHRRKLIRAHYGRSVRDWGWIGFVVAIVVMSFSNIAAAYLARGAVKVGETIAIERQGKVQVEAWFAKTLHDLEALRRQPGADAQQLERLRESAYALQAQSIVAETGGNRTAAIDTLRATYRSQGTDGFVERSSGAPAFSALSRWGVWPAMAGSLALLLWSLLLVFQVEGFEFSPQQRSQPMWEWLFSHPAPPAAIFLAEMLSPLVATPIYYSAPLFPGLLYGATYGAGHGVLAAIVIGLPIVLAAGCLGKAIEITCMLLLAPRTRGTVFGIMGWFSFVASMLIIFGAVSVRELPPVLAWMEPLAAAPWPFIGLFLGQQADGSFSFVSGMLACWTVAAATIAASVAVAVFSARRGLSGNVNAGDLAPKGASSFSSSFAASDPFYRKELLWLARDRSAVVMAVMIPLTIGVLQLFSTRGLYSIAVSDWNFICAAAIIVGTYFLLILGPRALAAEGDAFWTVLTWPRALEDLFKAKARLWTWLATALASPLFFYAAWRFPANIAQIALVGAGWWVFARSLAEKSATLLVVTTGTGETRGVSWGRRMAVSLGVMTFATGVMTRQWAVAIAGIVYSIFTAGAMWQNFRARLPYLFDPWSEKPPPAPAMMHAMIAISALAEGATLLAGTVVIGLGVEQFAIARAISFCIFAVVVSLIVAKFLRNRGVSFSDNWLWRKTDGEQAAGNWRLAPSLLTGAALGALLGALAFGYLALLDALPMTAGFMDQMAARRAALPNLHIAYFVMAVLFAPAAEEYLFRGLLYRTLDREWGGWLAVLASAVFFMIYHPFVSWLPVGAVGIAAALVFRRTGHLAAAVALHTVYNAIVVAI